MNLQDSFLNQVRISKTPVSVYLTNGYQIKGTVSGFDSFVIILDVGGRQNLVYKHAVSTMAPLVPIKLFKENRTEDEEKDD